MVCIRPIIKQAKDVTLNKLLCLHLLLNTMVDILNVQKFQKIINHVNYHSMHFISLSTKYNDINSLKLMFYSCNKKCIKINIIDKRFIKENEKGKEKEEEENDSKLCKKFKNGLYFAKIKTDIEMERYLRNIFNGNTANVSVVIENMVDCLISESICSTAFSPCQSLKNRIKNVTNNDNSNKISSNNSSNNGNNKNQISVFIPTTILQSGKTDRMVDNHHIDCENRNRAKNRKILQNKKQQQRKRKTYR